MAKCMRVTFILEGDVRRLWAKITSTVRLPIAETTINMLFTMMDILCPSLYTMSSGNVGESVVLLTLPTSIMSRNLKQIALFYKSARQGRIYLQDRLNTQINILIPTAINFLQEIKYRLALIGCLQSY